MKRSACLVVAVLLAIGSAGCVTRRYVITSDPPGAVVYRNGQPIGATPVEEPFIYYGKYHFRLVKDGYQPLDVEPELVAPWYQWPGVDLLTETIVPYPFRDVQMLHFQLQPVQQVRHDDIRGRAEQLRQRGMQIQTPPGTENTPRPVPPGAVAPPPGAPLPPSTIVPAPPPGQILPAPATAPPRSAPAVTPSSPVGPS